MSCQGSPAIVTGLGSSGPSTPIPVSSHVFRAVDIDLRGWLLLGGRIAAKEQIFIFHIYLKGAETISRRHQSHSCTVGVDNRLNEPMYRRNNDRDPPASGRQRGGLTRWLCRVLGCADSPSRALTSTAISESIGAPQRSTMTIDIESNAFGEAHSPYIFL